VQDEFAELSELVELAELCELAELFGLVELCELIELVALSELFAEFFAGETFTSVRTNSSPSPTPPIVPLPRLCARR